MAIITDNIEMSTIIIINDKRKLIIMAIIAIIMSNRHRQYQ